MKYVLPALLVIAIGLLIFKFARDKETSPEIQMEMLSQIRVVKVVEVLQTSSYTYLQVKEKNQKYWMAVIKQEAQVGDIYSWETASEMKDFPSKELDRVFESIYFVDNLFRGDGTQGRAIPMEHQTSKPRTDIDETINIEKAEGGISIAELFAKKKKFEGKRVKIKGRVVKVNPMVMGKNWVHIQDGTRDGDDFDLTITTMENIEKNQVVTFEGIITLDKDFGAGYFYKVIMEEAEVIQE
ncbi:MAG: GW dipeptide domain-containing protein [Bacteroidota bacterium]|nr:GW dipeptide domain-containing protein [Bacteroidota bacterium]